MPTSTRLVRVSRYLGSGDSHARDGSVLEGRGGMQKEEFAERERKRERNQRGSETRLRSLVYSRDPLYEDGPFARDKAPVEKKKAPRFSDDCYLPAIY